MQFILKKLFYAVLCMLVGGGFVGLLCALGLFAVIEPLSSVLHGNNFVAPWIPLFPTAASVVVVFGACWVFFIVYRGKKFKDAFFKGTLSWILVCLLTSFFAPFLILWSMAFPFAPFLIVGRGPQDDTVLASQFSFDKYPSIHVGQTEQEVKDIVGQPTHVFGNDEKTNLRYSYSLGGNNYWIVLVQLNTKKVVIGKDLYYYLD